MAIDVKREHSEKNIANRIVPYVVSGSIWVILFSNVTFAAVSICLGQNFEGSEESPAYMVFVGIADVICALYFANLVRGGISIRRPAWVLIAIAVLTMLAIFVNRDRSTEYNTLLYYCAFSFPGILCGVMFAAAERRMRLCVLAEGMFVLLSCATAVFMFVAHGTVSGSNEYGFSYQTMSYMSALAIGLGIWCINTSGARRSELLLPSNNFGQLIRFVFVGIAIIGVLQSGGRGGALLAVAYLALFVVWKLRDGGGAKGIALLLVIAIALYVAMLFSIDSQGLNRILFRGDNRSENVFVPALNLLSQSPFVGFGFGGYYDLLGAYAHNLVLDILLSSGVLGMCVFAVMLVPFLHILNGLGKSNVAKGRLYQTIIMYTFIYLMASGSFLTFAPFWFCVGVSCSFDESETVRPCRE